MGKLTSIERKVNNANLNRGSSVAVDRIRGRHLMKIRERIAIRDEYICQICKRVTADGEVDHKQPLHLGGASRTKTGGGCVNVAMTKNQNGKRWTVGHDKTQQYQGGGLNL